MNSLVDSVTQFARELSAGPGIVAVSGGADSVALLLALAALSKERRLIVAHLNHQLRGAESDADASYVADLVDRLAEQGLPVTFRGHSLPVAELAREQRANLEELARRLRYEWFIQLARAEGASWVATGHTADDQTETVLFRLLRGTGLDGLRGIPPRRSLAPGVELFRPLFGVRRSQVLEFLQSQDQGFREDQSNADPSYTRNRLRHELLPLLARDYNPQIVSVLGRLAEQACEVQAYLQEEAAALLHEAELPRSGATLVFSLDALRPAPRVLVRMLFRQSWRREGWPEGELTFAHWDRLADLACGAETAFDLPGGVQARRVGRVLQLGKR